MSDIKINECTCTIYRSWDWDCWSGKFVDIIISRTSFDLYWIRSVATALLIARAINFTRYNTIFQPRMRATKPQRTKTSTWHVGHTPLRHLSTWSINEESIPAIPFNTSVIESLYMDKRIPVTECGSPVVVECVVVIAWVIICVSEIKTNQYYFN